jgi:hypothetical protein
MEIFEDAAYMYLQVDETAADLRRKVRQLKVFRDIGDSRRYLETGGIVADIRDGGDGRRYLD